MHKKEGKPWPFYLFSGIVVIKFFKILGIWTTSRRTNYKLPEGSPIIHISAISWKKIVKPPIKREKIIFLKTKQRVAKFYGWHRTWRTEFNIYFQIGAISYQFVTLCWLTWREGMGTTDMDLSILFFNKTWKVIMSIWYIMMSILSFTSLGSSWKKKGSS